MKPIIYSILLSLLISSFIFTKSYVINKNQLTRDEVLDDLNYLVSNLIEIHPDPFSSIEKNLFESKVLKIKKKLKEIVHEKMY